jgi:uncharacterized protein YjiS (DUF1127 family)
MAIAPVDPLSVLIGVAGVGAIALSTLRPCVASLLHHLLRRHDGRRQRTALLDLDARRLCDVGLSRDAAEREGLRHD